MEIIVRSKHHSGHGLHTLENQIATALSDRGRLTGSGAGFDGWHLYVELVQDATEEELRRLATTLAGLALPKRTFIQCVGPDGKTRRLAIDAEHKSGPYFRKSINFLKMVRNTGASAIWCNH